MFLLALDTSGASGSVAVLENDRILSEVSWTGSASHTVELPNQMQKVLEASGLSLSKMEAFALTIGPGSFTGIRVGLSFVKGLALAGLKPVMGVSTLRSLSRGVAEEGFLCPWIDARREEIYGALFEKRGGKIHPILGERATPPEPFLEEIITKRKPSSRLHFLGSGAQKYKEKILNKIDANHLFLNGKYDSIRAGSVGLEGYELFLNGKVSKGGIDLHPQYLRASEAELKIQRKEKPDLTEGE